MNIYETLERSTRCSRFHLVKCHGYMGPTQKGTACTRAPTCNVHHRLNFVDISLWTTRRTTCHIMHVVGSCIHACRCFPYRSWFVYKINHEKSLRIPPKNRNQIATPKYPVMFHMCWLPQSTPLLREIEQSGNAAVIWSVISQPNWSLEMGVIWLMLIECLAYAYVSYDV